MLNFIYQYYIDIKLIIHERNSKIKIIDRVYGISDFKLNFEKKS